MKTGMLRGQENYRDNSLKSLSVGKFLPVNRVYQYITHPYSTVYLILSLYSPNTKKVKYTK